MTDRTSSKEFYDLADQYMNEKRYDEAIELYKKLIELNPGDDSLVFSLAWAYKDGGKRTEAITCFEQLFEKELKRKVFTGFAFDEMIRIFREEGNYEKVVELCEKAVTAQPADPSLLTTLGSSCISAGRVERAIEVFELLTRMEPDSPTLFCLLGDAYVAAGNLDRADEVYEKAINIEPTEAHTFYNKLGNAYEQAGYYERAENALRNAIVHQPDRSLYHSILGDILVKQGKLDEAQQAYEHAIELDPKFEAAYYNRLAHTLVQENHRLRAIEMYEKAINADPKNLYCYKSLIDLCTSEGLDEKAREIYEKAKSLNLIPS
ncbi:MAG: tetratricopeptide repeat protein [Deltaproteobacteria bacterium]|nr:tetratricopeptide repeat protein [Deltaproteobacteria bacterium]